MAGKNTADSAFVCFKCGVPLEPGKVTVYYMDNGFPIELLKCKKCGLVLITEELALGKMLEVEKTLEDK